MKLSGSCQEDLTLGDVKEEEQNLTIWIMILSDRLNYCMEILSPEVFNLYVYKVVAQEPSRGLCLVPW